MLNWTGERYLKASNEEIDDKIIVKESYFRKYNSVDEFVADHSNFITSTEWRKKHYSSVINAKDYKEQANALTSTYATDTAYGSKLIALIEQYNLTQYDNKKERGNMVKKVNVSLLNRGKMPSIKGVVIHNDAGSMTPEQYIKWLKNRDLTLGIAHYYINRHCIARVVDTYNVAWHTGNQTGNRHYIGFEVCESMKASDSDFLANEDMTLMQATEDLLFYGLPINHDTVKLHHEFSPTSCPHRSMALHGNTTASVKQYFIDRMSYFASLGKTVEEMIEKSTSQPKTAQQIERGGTRTPDIVQGTLKELVEGSVVEVRQQATHYYNGKTINPVVNGQKYTITGKMAIDNQYSKFAYRLAQNGVAIGWVYAHDIVEAYQQPEPQTPQKESQKITLGGKNYTITEE